MASINCAYCSTSFDRASHKSKRKTCSRACARKLTLEREGRSAWLQKELDLLEKLAEERTPEQILARLNRFRVANGLKPRTLDAVKVKMKKRGLSLRTTLDCFSRSELARILGITRGRVRHWLKNGLKCEATSLNREVVTRKALKSFAFKHSRFFKGIDRFALEFIFDDDAIVSKCYQPATKNLGLPQPVMRLDTGEKFLSLTEAAAKSYLHRSCISSAIARGGTAGGTKWLILNGGDRCA